MSVTPALVWRYQAEEMSDASLVRAVLAGDPAAFSVLVDRHARVCLRFATRMLGSHEDAEEATQETFLRAYRALARYDERMNFRTWLMSILANRCRTALLHRRRRVARVVLDGDAVAVAADRSVASDSELRDAIERALLRLEPAQREAFLLRHVEQLSYEQMAEVTGAGISALKMRVRRACKKLQHLLHEDRYD